MNCENCTNKKYCEPYKRVENLRGCGTGIPQYLPSEVAKPVVWRVNRAVEEMGFNRDEYAKLVLEEIKKALDVR